MAEEHAVANETVGDRENTPNRADKTTLVVFLVFVAPPRCLANLAERGPQQPESEDEEHPREARHQRGPEEDEHETQEQGDDNAEEQGFLLILSRNAECLENQDEHEEVVDGQGPLHGPSRIELLSVEPPVCQPDTDAEKPGESDVEQGPSSGLDHCGRVRVARMTEEIDHDQADGHKSEDSPRPRVNNHEYPLTI